MRCGADDRRMVASTFWYGRQSSDIELGAASGQASLALLNESQPLCNAETA